MTNYQMSDLIGINLVTDLEAEFIKPDVTPEELVGVVRGGNLQENPVKARIYILVHVNDPDDPGWQDMTTAHRDTNLQEKFFYTPAFEVGGGSLWWRRGSIEFGIFATKSKEDRDEVRRIANITKGRIEKVIALHTATLGTTDTLGEVAIKVLPITSRLEEGGGPPRSFIWRGVVRFQLLTERPF